MQPFYFYTLELFTKLKMFRVCEIGIAFPKQGIFSNSLNTVEAEKSILLQIFYSYVKDLESFRAQITKKISNQSYSNTYSL